MTFEQFCQGNSLLHRRDTRVKLLSAICLILVLALCQTYHTAFAGLLLGMLSILVAGLPLKQVLFRLLLVNGFVAFLWLTLPLTYPGTTVLNIGPFYLTEQGIALAGLITIKTNAIVLLLIGLLSTSSVAEIGHGLERLKLPVKLCLLLLFSYRYIFVIRQEYQRLARAARLRSFRPGTNLHTYRTFGFLFGMTLLKSWHRAERVRQAMMLRGFQGRFVSLDSSVISVDDILFFCVAGGTAIALSAMELFL